MIKTTSAPPFEDTSVDNCEALLVCLSGGKFVIVRTSEPKNLWPVDGGWQKLRDLKPGDEVIYKGNRTRVRALDVYR